MRYPGTNCLYSVSFYSAEDQAKPMLQQVCYFKNSVCLPIAPVFFYFIRRSPMAMMFTLLRNDVQVTPWLVSTTARDSPFSLVTQRSGKLFLLATVNARSCLNKTAVLVDHVIGKRYDIIGQVAVAELCSGTQLKLIWRMTTENFPPLNIQNGKLRSTTKISEL